MRKDGNYLFLTFDVSVHEYIMVCLVRLCNEGIMTRCFYICIHLLIRDHFEQANLQF